MNGSRANNGKGRMSLLWSGYKQVSDGSTRRLTISFGGANSESLGRRGVKKGGVEEGMPRESQL